MIPTDSIKSLPSADASPGAAPSQAAKVADKVAGQSSFGLQMAGCITHCVTREWSTFFRAAKFFTGVQQHLARVGYAGLRAAQTRNNETLLESGIAETLLKADEVLGNEKFATLSELADRVSEGGEEILRPVTLMATAKALEPLFSQAEKSFEQILYALSVNSAKIAGLNRFLQLLSLFENQADPIAKFTAHFIFETYLSCRILSASLQSSNLVGKIVKLGTFLAACECVHRASTLWKKYRFEADTEKLNRAKPPKKAELRQQIIFDRLSAKATTTTDPQTKAIVDRIPALRTVLWIHRLLSFATHPVRTGWSHTVALTYAGVIGGVLGKAQTV